MLMLNPPEPSVLPGWPPFRPQRVVISGRVTDNSGVARAVIALHDEYRRRPFTFDITRRLSDDGSFQLVFRLSPVVRGRDDDGRVYAFALSAVDTEGNASGPESVVVVAERQSRGRGHRNR